MLYFRIVQKGRRPRFVGIKPFAPAVHRRYLRKARCGARESVLIA